MTHRGLLYYPIIWISIVYGNQPTNAMTWDHTIFFVKAQVFWIRLSEPSPFSCYRLQEGHIRCIVIGKMVVPFGMVD